MYLCRMLCVMGIIGVSAMMMLSKMDYAVFVVSLAGCQLGSYLLFYVPKCSFNFEFDSCFIT